jgi:hypothetical protein
MVEMTPAEFDHLVDWLHHADPNRTRYKSAPFTFKPSPKSKPWTPHTYEDRYFGPETLTKATLLSDNSSTLSPTLDLGPRSVSQVAHEEHGLPAVASKDLHARPELFLVEPNLGAVPEQ